MYETTEHRCKETENKKQSKRQKYSSNTPKVVLNDHVCVLSPSTLDGCSSNKFCSSLPSKDREPISFNSFRNSSSDMIENFSSNDNVNNINKNQCAATLTPKSRPGSLRTKIQNSLSQEFFSTSIAETEVASIFEVRLETTEHPPSIENLREATRCRFSTKWLKYMYAKFKSECPNGRMRIHEFKRLMGFYLPDRISDAYIERFFYALCAGSTYDNQLTFQDLVINLALLTDADARQNAEFMIRLINYNQISCANSSRVTIEEFADFVKSVFLLVGRKMSVRKTDTTFAVVTASSGTTNLLSSERCSSGLSNLSLSTRKMLIRHQQKYHCRKNEQLLLPSPSISTSVIVVERATLMAIRKRATAIFQELDTENRGYLTSENFERVFRAREITTH